MNSPGANALASMCLPCHRRVSLFRRRPACGIGFARAFAFCVCGTKRLCIHGRMVSDVVSHCTSMSFCFHPLCTSVRQSFVSSSPISLAFFVSPQPASRVFVLVFAFWCVRGRQIFLLSWFHMIANRTAWSCVVLLRVIPVFLILYIYSLFSCSFSVCCRMKAPVGVYNARITSGAYTRPVNTGGALQRQVTHAMRCIQAPG